MVLITQLVFFAILIVIASDVVLIILGTITHPTTVGFKTRPVAVSVIEIGRSTCGQDITRFLTLLRTGVGACGVVTRVARHHVGISREFTVTGVIDWLWVFTRVLDMDTCENDVIYKERIAVGIHRIIFFVCPSKCMIAYRNSKTLIFPCLVSTIVNLDFIVDIESTLVPILCIGAFAPETALETN